MYTNYFITLDQGWVYLKKFVRTTYKHFNTGYVLSWKISYLFQLRHVLHDFERKKFCLNSPWRCQKVLIIIFTSDYLIKMIKNYKSSWDEWQKLLRTVFQTLQLVQNVILSKVISSRDISSTNQLIRYELNRLFSLNTPAHPHTRTHAHTHTLSYVDEISPSLDIVFR